MDYQRNRRNERENYAKQKAMPYQEEVRHLGNTLPAFDSQHDLDFSIYTTCAHFLVSDVKLAQK